ncbi:hypothetical protein [Cellulosimicrobium protaetiae]|uniref:Secreted protein n=1 Tax=Cellulosimicrobium protaetiae TaxID=2587808 RepID=A0A6M5UHI3_9MICO|nr:hypothetical protein [Cellulosimicrobium protaetiae]QJW38097.1 hypothetical protein FIC82_019890 [Cellulosimicrobium protaetiae]
MKFKRLVAVVATAAALAVAAPTAASAAETRTYTNHQGGCRVLAISYANAGGAKHTAYYRLEAGRSKTFSTAGIILGHSWSPC